MLRNQINPGQRQPLGELDVDLLLSPLEERKVVGGVSGGVASSDVGGVTVERKMSIAEMKAEM